MLAVAELEHHVADLQTALGHHEPNPRNAPLVLSDADDLALELSRDDRLPSRRQPVMSGRPATPGGDAGPAGGGA